MATKLLGSSPGLDIKEAPGDTATFVGSYPGVPALDKQDVRSNDKHKDGGQ